MNSKIYFIFNSKEKLIILFLTCIVKDVFSEILWSSPSSLCSLCGKTTTDFTKKFCPLNSGFQIENRCCLNHVNKTVGVDLGDCNITNIPPLDSIKDTTWVNLALNPNLKCKGDNFTDLFEGFKKLHMIVLPDQCRSCPGGNLLWSHHQRKEKALNCTGQLNFCKVLNRTCPANSDCHNNGPGFYECLCSGGYYGYKCLIVDGMPLVITLCAIAGATVVIIVPIWFLIWRRKRIHNSGYVIMN